MKAPSPQNCIIPKGFIFLLFIGFCSPAFAQIKKGEKLMQQGLYTEAVKPLKKEFYGSSKEPKAGILLAKCYYELRQYSDALEVMNSIEESSITDAEDRRFYADVFIVNDDFSSAYVELIRILSDDPSDPTTYMWLDKVTNLLAWDSIPNGSKVNTIAGINSVYNEYAPYITADGDLIFVCDANTVQTVFPSSYNNQNLHLYYQTKTSERNENQVNRPVMLMKKREYYYHDGPMDYWTNHGKYAFTLRDIDSPDQRIGIYFSTFSGKEEDLIPFKFNEKFNTGHPSFCRDGDRIIFASDRPGGYGQMDLWYSDWVKDTWTEPVNMGPIINTPFNEVFPNYFENRLYFSSDRRDMGYGALDIYYANELLGYNQIYNLRAPINSAYDDFAPTFGNDYQGYFSSSRLDGTGGDDIYGFSFKPVQTTIPLTNLQIVDAELPSGTPVEIKDQAGNIVVTTVTNDAGRISAENLNSDEVYTLSVKGVDLKPGAELHVLSKAGLLVTAFKRARQREFDFQLLPQQDHKVSSEDNTDYSVLKYNIDGQLIAAQDVDLSNVKVSVKSPNGDVLGTTTTSEKGKFTIEGINSGEEYTIETLGLTAPHQVDVYGKSGAIEQSLSPIGANRFSYTRAAPPATWMESSEIRVQRVMAALSNGKPSDSEEITLFNEADSVVAHPAFNTDNLLMLGSLIAGRAYRLNLPERTLIAEDRLYIIGHSGDTLQTIRPFDANNYFFEYMLNSDFGGLESPQPIKDELDENPQVVYKMKIENFDLPGGTAFWLQVANQPPFDTIMGSDKGIVLLRNIKPDVEYQLVLADTTFTQNKLMHIYDSGNQEATSGTSADYRIFNFKLSVAGDELESLFNVGLAGRFVSDNMNDKGMTIYNSDSKKLAETYMTEPGNFKFDALPRNEKYIVKTVNSDKNAKLRILPTQSKDSVWVSRAEDGNFYINMNNPESESLTLVDQDKSDVTVGEGIHFKLPEVYYDFNSYYLKANSRKSIDKLLVFLRDNPEVRVEIQSHTDSQGPESYNMLLSQRRADAVVEYLTDKGIAKSRLVAVGKGETELTNKCKDGVPCTEAEHAVNRRTEFVILKGSK